MNIDKASHEVRFHQMLAKTAEQMGGECGVDVSSEEIFHILTKLTSVTRFSKYPGGAKSILGDRFEAAAKARSEVKTEGFILGIYGDGFYPCEPDAINEAMPSMAHPVFKKAVFGLVIQRADWRVAVFYCGDKAEIGCVSTFNKNSQGQWMRQGVPSVSPSEVFLYRDYGEREMPFVLKESYFSDGLLWNPRPGTPADVCYHPNGAVRWRRWATDGKFSSTNAGPCLEVFAENGAPVLVEYGKEGVGRHRSREDGPAYSEFHRNGQVALQVFAENGRILKTNWFDQDGSKMARSVDLRGWVQRGEITTITDETQYFEPQSNISDARAWGEEERKYKMKEKKKGERSVNSGSNGEVTSGAKKLERGKPGAEPKNNRGRGGR